MGSETRCHFVNPKYDGAPRPAVLPEPRGPAGAPGHRRSSRSTRCGPRGSPRTRPRPACPSLVIPGGGVVEGGAAAAAMQHEVAEIAIRHGIALVGPNCMGVVDLTANSATYIGDVSPYLPRGGVAGIAQSGTRDRRVHPLPGTRVGFSRIVSLSGPRSSSTCATTSRTAWTTRRHLGHPVRGGVQATGAVPRPGGPGARAGQADHGRQGGPVAARRRPPRSPTAAAWPARTG